MQMRRGLGFGTPSFCLFQIVPRKATGITFLICLILIIYKFNINYVYFVYTFIPFVIYYYVFIMCEHADVCKQTQYHLMHV